MPYQASKQTTAGRDLRQTAPVVGPHAVTITRGKSSHCEERLRNRKQSRTLCRRPWISLRLKPQCYDARKRKAERRKALFRNRRALAGTARALGGALASRRSTTALAAATERHRSARATRLPGTRSERPPRWFERRSASQRTFTRKPTAGLPCVTRGRYPRLTVPVQRDCTRSPVMMPSGRVLPKPPESRGDEPRPAGTALAPPDGVTRPASWYVGEIRCLYLNYVTHCQVRVFDIGIRNRHGRACPGHPRLSARPKDVDARHEAGHDGLIALRTAMPSSAPVIAAMHRDRAAFAAAAPYVNIDDNHGAGSTRPHDKRGTPCRRSTTAPRT